MPLEFRDDVAVLSGSVTAEEAEPLLAWLQDHRPGRVDLAGATHLHTAVLQLLLLAAPEVVRPFEDPFLSRWVPLPRATLSDALEVAV